MMVDPTAVAAAMSERRENVVAMTVVSGRRAPGEGCTRPWAERPILMNTEARVSRRHIGQPQLHPLGAVPAIEA